MIRLGDTLVNTLRTRMAGRSEGSRQGMLALRLDLSSRLEGADLRPPGLPPPAILIVRSMSDPAPRRLQAESGTLDVIWERSARQAIAQHYRRAARPHRGRLPANAEAVVFEDQAEMLACLALDLIGGEAWGRWWWRAILRQLGKLQQAELPARVFFLEPRHVPAALSKLETWGLAEAVVRRIEPEHALSVLEAVAAAYALPWIAVHRSEGLSLDAPAVVDRRQNIVVPERWSVEGRHRRIDSRWKPGGLTREQALLLVVALSLQENPGCFSSPERAAALREWWAQTDGAPEWAPVPGAESPPQDPEFREVASEAEEHDVSPAGVPVTNRTVPPPAIDADPIADFEELSLTSPATRTNRERARTRAGSPIPPIPRSRLQRSRSSTWARTELNDPLPEALRPEDPASSRADRSIIVISSPDPTGQADSLPEEVFTETRLGGLFFLVNLMNALALPGSLMELQMGAWGILEVIGRGLLASETSIPFKPAADPIWRCLATLDGREPGEMPRAGDAPPTKSRARDGALLKGMDRRLVRWVRSSIGAIRSRLARAMQISEDEVASTLLLREGRVYITSSHVDLVLPLESISVAVRRAGLDVDPGWQPRFGRVILFHYRGASEMLE